MKFRRPILASFSLLYALATQASPFGFTYSQALIAQDPSNLSGFRTAITYQPRQFIWHYWQIYFDASYGHWWVNKHQRFSELDSYSIAPYVRYWFTRQPDFSPYFQISIAPAYVTRTRISSSNLGMHFIFQDQIGLGAAWGRERKFYTDFLFTHYSNGSFCSQNQGITVPLVVTFGYQF